VDVRFEFAGACDCVVSVVYLLVEGCKECLCLFRGGEEFEVGLLVHVPVLRTPAMDWMVAADAIDDRLRVDREVAGLVELG